LVEILERLRAVLAAHDAAAMAALFTEDYASEQPLHPNRGFGGRDQVAANWTAMFSGIPDFEAELLGSATAGDEVWSEWRWHGTYRDGSPFQMRGVTIMRLRGDRIAAARLYMEPVEEGGAAIDEAVRRQARSG
jgi:ketosteroid isomerase-like protein